jgi:dGTPase
MSEEVMSATNELRAFMFKNVYDYTNVAIQERAKRMLTQMFLYFKEHIDKLPQGYLRLLERDGVERVVCDYIAGMTDRYAINVFESLFIPSTFSVGGLV